MTITSTTPGLSPRQQLIRLYLNDRPLAHRVLFKHRHPQGEAPFHRQMINDWHSSIPYVLDLVFREGAKSTLAEEAIVLMALFRKVKNGLVVSSSKALAEERLHAIRHEAVTNEDLQRLFLTDLALTTESDNELIFANGRRIVARGRGQSLRGTKFEEQRPDLIFIDDMEGDLSAVNTPEARQKNWHWLQSDLLPAGDSQTKRVRMAATLMHPESVPARLEKDPEWSRAPTGVVHKFPLLYKDEEGEWQSSWPERRSTESALRMREAWSARGELDRFNQEYMCLAESPETKLFKGDMIRVEPRIRTWQAVYSMTDPARTTLQKS